MSITILTDLDMAEISTADPKQIRFCSLNTESDSLHVMKGIVSGKVQVAEHLRYLQ